MHSCNRDCMAGPSMLVKEGIITDVNDSFLELSCFSYDDLVNKPLEVVWSDSLRISTGISPMNRHQEAYLFTKSLEARHVDINAEIHSNSGIIIFTFLEKPESRLDNKCSFLKNIYSCGTTGFAIYSAPDLILLKANQMAFNFLDKPYNEAFNGIGRNAAKIISGFMGSDIEKKWHSAIETGEVYEIREIPYEGFDTGTTFWNMKCVPIYEDGIVKYLIQIIDDVTQSVLDRIKLEKQTKIIKEQKKELEAIIQSMSDALYIIDKNDRVDLINDEAKGRIPVQNIDNCSPGFGEVRHFHLNGREIPYDELPVIRALKGEKIKNFKVLVKQPHKEYIAQITAMPIYDEEGNITKAIVCSHDITELINNGKVLKEKNELLEIIIENMSDGLCVVDKEGNFIKINGAFKELLRKLYGAKAMPVDVETVAISELNFHNEHGEPILFEDLPVPRVLKGERIEKEKVMYKSEQGNIIIDISGTPIFDEDGKFLYGITLGHDITQIVERERLTHNQKEELEAIIENFDDAIFIYDKDGNHYMQNKAARDYHISTNLHVFGEGDDYTKYYDLNNMEIPQGEMPFFKAQRGQAVKDERIKMVQGNRERYVSVSCRPLYNLDGNMQLSILHSRDITEDVKKEHIIREQQEMLLKGERDKQEALKASMEFKDEFLYLITHEFRTPINVINSALQAIELMHKGEIGEKVWNYLKMIKQNTNRQLRLVNNLLDITRINSGNIRMNMSSFDVVHVVQTIVDSVRIYGQEKGVALNFTSHLEKREIFSDDEKIERILLNLLANALKFTPSEKTINVLLSEVEHKGRRMISICVEDEGIGIPYEKQREIFERFGQVDSSLSRKAEGTGLGLYLVKLLVQALEGEIILKSEVHRGSTFIVLLPICELRGIIKEEDECNKEFLYTNERIFDSVVIEFSDIYF